MCGIAGVYNQNGGSPDVELVRAMGLTMVHRGPDNFGVSVSGRTAMSHNRLSLLDLSAAANQPYGNGDYLLSYNGEIYNFREIRSRLEHEFGINFTTTSDTEVLYQALINYGCDKAIRLLQGMFAFSFYDKAKNTLVLARDRLGIKPLYYFAASGQVYWSSEVKAIARTLDLMPDPIRTFFAINNMGEKSTEHTLFKGLRSVKPGSYLVINGSGDPKPTTYYDVLDDFDKDLHRSLLKQSGASIVGQFEELFADSVKRMLVSDVPVGAFVSGGIDSSLTSAVAMNCDADLKLFTANVLGRYSEFDDVKILGRHLNREIYEYRFEPHMMLRDWARTTYHYDCPIVIHVNAIPFSNVAKLAHDSGIKAALTGEGADELFLGYPSLLGRRYERVLRLPLDLMKSAYKLSPRMYAFLFPERNPLPTFTSDLVGGFEILKLKERADATLTGLSKREREEQYLSIRMARDHLITLLHRNDRMGMMGSIEARFPFLDEAIVKFAISLPVKYKMGLSARFHNYKHPFLTDKWVVRKLAEKYLPRPLVTKRKNGFPMFGHKFVKVKSGFFSNGWVADSLGLSRSDIDYIVATQEPYFVAKLASVDIFGRIFAMKTDLEELRRHIVAHADIET